jgi:predicted secreted hydrolase
MGALKVCLVLLIICFPVIGGGTLAGDADYRSVTGPCTLAFPDDHGAHAGYRVEWWYYTGNLETLAGERFGFQLTFFRVQPDPPGVDRSWPEQPSAWRTEHLYLAHAAVSDLNRLRFYYDEEIARGAVGLAGAKQGPGATRVFVGKWSARLGARLHHLRASSNRFVLDLTCRPAKPPVLHGDGGYSRKGERPEEASCYYSLTRLETTGTLSVDGRAYPVKGTSWMDHEFSTAPLAKDILGWDWFSIQLSNNMELMIYLLRQDQGRYHTASSGTLISPSGRSRHLTGDDFTVKILDRWKSPRTGALYPSRWRIRIGAEDIELRVRSNLDDQELVTEKTTRIVYWEGSVSVSGSVAGKGVDGVGYVEMTGYAAPFPLLR